MHRALPCCARASTALLLLPLHLAHNILLHPAHLNYWSADLKSPDKGGQTAFPEAQTTRDAMGAQHRPGNSPDEWYCNDDRALSAAPPAGTGVMFWCAGGAGGAGQRAETGGRQPAPHREAGGMAGGGPPASPCHAVAARPLQHTPGGCNSLIKQPPGTSLCAGTTAPAQAPAPAATRTAAPTPRRRRCTRPCTLGAPCG